MMVAETIKGQLGGGTLAMLGAHSLVGGDSHLQFKVRGSRKVNTVVITLAADDTYTIAFWRVRGAKFSKVSELSGVYVDSLHEVIERETGLYTRL